MTPEEARQVQFHLCSAAKILKANTSEDELQDFESIELAARQHLLDTVGPAMADVFLPRRSQTDWKTTKTEKQHR